MATFFSTGDWSFNLDNKEVVEVEAVKNCFLIKKSETIPTTQWEFPIKSSSQTIP